MNIFKSKNKKPVEANRLEAFLDIRLTRTEPHYWPGLPALIQRALAAKTGFLGIERLPRQGGVFLRGATAIEAYDVRIWFIGDDIESRAKAFILDAESQGFFIQDRFLRTTTPWSDQRTCDLIPCGVSDTLAFTDLLDH